MVVTEMREEAKEGKVYSQASVQSAHCLGPEEEKHHGGKGEMEQRCSPGESWAREKVMRTL